MTAQNPVSVAHSTDSRSGPIHTEPAELLTDEERERIREYYRSLNFKEFLAACPIDGIGLSRNSPNPENPIIP